jgi:competence protein ComEC
MKPDDSPLRSVPPLYPILLAYLLGIAVASRVSLSRLSLLVMMGVLLCFTLISLIRSKRGGSPLLWAGGFFLLGILALEIQLYPPSPGDHVRHFATGERVIVEGILRRAPVWSPKRVRLYVKAHTLIVNDRAIPTRGMVLLSMPHLDKPLEYGDRIRFATRLRRPTNFNNPGGFDYQRYLSARRIWTTAFVKNPNQVIRVATGQGNPLWTRLESLRHRIRGFMDTHASDTARPILKALVLGERSAIPEVTREEFAISGAAHILAISGLHLGIIALILFRLFSWVLRQSERIALGTNIFKVTALVTIPPIVLYTLISGGRITTVRATIMIMAYLVSIIIDRPRDLYHTLAVAALAITLFDPMSLMEASFQLSFTAVLAILFLFPRLNHLLTREEPIPVRPNGLVEKAISWGRGLFLVSLAAMIGTCPIIAYHFHRFSPMGLVTNFLVIPLLGFFAIPAALIAALFAPIYPSLGIPFVHAAGWVVDLTTSVIHAVASLPGAALHVSTPTLLEIAIFYAFVFLIFQIRRASVYRIALVVVLGLGLADVSYWLVKTHWNRALRITTVDVGHGDCTLVEFPKGKKALIDGGGFYDDSFDIGKNVVAPFLWKKKIQKIDFLVLSHPDPDHLNGLKFIAQTFRVKELWDSGQESTSPFFQEFMRIVAEKGIERVSLSQEDDPRTIHGVLVQVLHPSRDGCQTREGTRRCSANNRSLVLRFVFGGQTFLFTGDIEKEAESELVASGLDLESRVLKVPHHGSLTSSTMPFLRKVRPDIAVVCAGHRGLSRASSQEVLSRYEGLGCQIFRTDRDGAIAMETNGKRLRIRTFRKAGKDRGRERKG